MITDEILQARPSSPLLYIRKLLDDIRFHKADAIECRRVAAERGREISKLKEEIRSIRLNNKKE